MTDVPDQDCAKAGRAAYLDVSKSYFYFFTRQCYFIYLFLIFKAISYYFDKYGMTDVGDSYFMSYHIPLTTDADWYESIRAARKIADNITNMISNANLTDEKINVFPYR